MLPMSLDDESGTQATRAGIRQLLVGATLVTTRQGLDSSSPDDLLDTKRVVEFMARLEVIHQIILWRVYWEGESMRAIASEWEMDELNVIREHKALVEYLQKCIAKDRGLEPLRIRPGLKRVALDLKRSNTMGPFTKVLTGGP